MTILETFRTDDLEQTFLTLEWNNIRDEADTSCVSTSLWQTLFQLLYLLREIQPQCVSTSLWQTLFQLLYLLREIQPQLGTIRVGSLIVEMRCPDLS